MPLFAKENAMTSTISVKGQVTIPAEVRRLMHLRAGDSVSFVFVSDNRVEMIGSCNPIKRLRGIVPKPSKPVPVAQMQRAVGTGGWR